jgi:hypothetical protein
MSEAKRAEGVRHISQQPNGDLKSAEPTEDGRMGRPIPPDLQRMHEALLALPADSLARIREQAFRAGNQNLLWLLGDNRLDGPEHRSVPIRDAIPDLSAPAKQKAATA